MRKLNLFLGIAALSMVVFFNSCSSDTNAVGPGIDLKSDAAVTAAPNSTITIEWTAYAGDANLKYFTITEGNSPVTGWDEYEIPSAQNENFASSAVVNIGTSNTQFTLTVTDKDGLKASVSVAVTVVAPLESQGTQQLGAGASALPSYYSVADATTMSLPIAKANPTKVDFVFTSTASAATFKSPKDATATEISGTNRVTNYQKVTLDFATATATDLDGITPSADNITVSANDVVVFKTHDNTKGIFKVESLTVATDGSVTINIKVKQ